MDTEIITKQRFDGWQKRLSEEHATPIILIGVGHEHKSGQLVICVPEGVDDELLVGALRFALASLLQSGPTPKHHGERATIFPNQN